MSLVKRKLLFVPAIVLLALLVMGASVQVGRSEFRELENRVNDLERRFARLDREVEFRTLERRVDDLQRDVAALQRQKGGGALEELTNLRKEMAAREEERQLRAIERRLADLEDEDAKLVRQMKSYAAQISELEERLRGREPKLSRPATNSAEVPARTKAEEPAAEAPETRLPENTP